jgi:glutathione S-transferase
MFASATMPEIKLFYFDVAGKGEGIRLACAVGKIPLDDVRLTREEFGAMKEKGQLPYGQVPALSVDGTMICQSAAILRFLGKLGGFYPEDPLKAAFVDSLIAQEGDMFGSVSCVRYQERFGFESLGGADSEATKTVEQAIGDRVLPRHLAFFEQVLTESSTGWLAGGDGPSIADFQLIPRLQWLQSGGVGGVDSATVLEPYPKLIALIEKFVAIPEIVAYYAENNAGK